MHYRKKKTQKQRDNKSCNFARAIERKCVNVHTHVHSMQKEKHIRIKSRGIDRYYVDRPDIFHPAAILSLLACVN